MTPIESMKKILINGVLPETNKISASAAIANLPPQEKSRKRDAHGFGFDYGLRQKGVIPNKNRRRCACGH